MPAGYKFDHPLPCLPAGYKWVDSFLALDAADGNITARATRFGAAAVSTSAPMLPTNPYVITYDVVDAAGNRAATKRRWVLVNCTNVRRRTSEEHRRLVGSLGVVVSQ